MSYNETIVISMSNLDIIIILLTSVTKESSTELVKEKETRLNRSPSFSLFRVNNLNELV